MLYFICFILANLTRLQTRMVPKTTKYFSTKNPESILHECKSCIHYIEIKDLKTTKAKDIMFSKCRKFPILPIPEEQKISAPPEKYYFSSYCRTSSVMCGEEGRFFEENKKGT